MLNLALANGSHSAYAPPAANYVFDFTSSLPSNDGVTWTFTRNNNLPTFRNTSGNLTRSTTNQPRFNCDINGVPIGLMIESARINRFAGSFAPTVTTGFSVTGTATIGLATDATALSASTCKLQALITGNVYVASGGASGGTVILPGTTTVTTNHSLSMWARLVSGPAGSMSHTSLSSPGTAAISNAAYTRVILEDQVISSTTVQMVINVPANTVINFILPQLEASPQVTSEILTSGAAGFTVADSLLGNFPAGFNTASGGMLLIHNYIARDLASRYIMSVSNGTTSDYMAIQEGNSKLAQFARKANSVISTSRSLIVPNRNVPYAAGMSWKSGVLNMIAGPGIMSTAPLSQDVIAGTTIGIGCSGTGLTQGQIHAQKLYLWNSYVEPWVMGQYMYNNTWNGVFTIGQSLIAGDIFTPNEQTPDGERAFNAALDTTLTSTVGKNVEAHGAYSGSGMLKKNSDGINFWWDNLTGVFGNSYLFAEQTAKAWKLGGGNIKAIVLSGHENDAYGLYSGQTTITEFKLGVNTIVNRLWSIFGKVPLIIEPIGRVQDTALYDRGFQLMHDAQMQLVAENPGWYHLAPEKIDLPLYSSDRIHLSAAGYATKATRNARKVLSVTGDLVGANVDGPRILNVSLSGTTLTLPVKFAGTDNALSITSAITGLRFYDNGVEIPITSSLASGNVITATLATAPLTLNHDLYMGYGTMYTEKDILGNYTKGNASGLPIRRNHWTSTDGGVTYNATAVFRTHYSFIGSTVPTPFTYSRASTNEFYRNSAGKYINATSGEARFDYNFNGVMMGLRTDASSTNKNTNTNWGMVGTTGNTLTGNGSGTLTVGTHPVHGHATLLLDNSLGGSGDLIMTIAGATGNTNVHSMGIVMRNLTATRAKISTTEDTAVVTGTVTNGDEWVRSENFVPASSATQMKVVVPLGGKVHLWLNQLEELEVATFPLLVAGATATRVTSSCSALTANLPTYNEAQGTLFVEFIPDRMDATVNQFVASIGVGGGTPNRYGIYMNGSTKGQIRARTDIAGQNKTGNDVHRPIRGRRFPTGMAYKYGITRMVAGPMRYTDNNVVYGNGPVGMTTLYAGGYSAATQLTGWIREVVVADGYIEMPAMRDVMFPNIRKYRGLTLAGQSNGFGISRAQGQYTNGGEATIIDEMNKVYPDSENWVVQVSRDGSSANKANDTNYGFTNYWYDIVTDTFGPCMAYAEAVMSAFGYDRLLPLAGWDQGASDQGDTYANFKEATFAIANRFVSLLGTTAMFLIRPISRAESTDRPSYGMVKAVQRDLVLENPTKIYEAPPQDNIDLWTDKLHMKDSSYITTGRNFARKALKLLGQAITGAVDPPRFSTGTRTLTEVWIPIQFPSGITALTPGTNIAGFRAFDGDPDDGGVEIVINSVVFTSNRVVLSLEHPPTGTLYIEYARSGLYVEAQYNLIPNLARGNDANGLGLAWQKIIVP